MRGCLSEEHEMKSAARHFVDLAVSALPPFAVNSVIHTAALAPRALKTPLFERICSKVARSSRINTSELALTNLGVSSRLRCEIPLAKADYVFGRPENIPSERATLALVAELSLDCAEFVDVGANEGIFTFLVSERTPAKGVRIHWFEPDRDLHDRLAKNLKKNLVESYGNRIAIADKKGETTFFKNLSDDTSGSTTDYFVEQHETRIERVGTTTLSDYFQDHGVRNAIVKIDVEGGGHAAWLGASRAAAEIRYLVMEMLAPEIEQGLPGKIISEAAFYAYYVRDFELVTSFDGSFRYVPPYWNWLFCRLDPTSLRSRLSGTKFRVVEQIP
jgi:FkbM family methyltransferase